MWSTSCAIATALILAIITLMSLHYPVLVLMYGVVCAVNIKLAFCLLAFCSFQLSSAIHHVFVLCYTPSIVTVCSTNAAGQDPNLTWFRKGIG